MCTGQRIFVRSSITGEQLEYFVPALIGKIDAASLDSSELPSLTTSGTPFRPFAAIVASRGRITLCADLLHQTKALKRMADIWSNKRVDQENVCELHAHANGKSKRSTYRDSMVWVDGLRPIDSKLIPGPASGLQSLMEDYFEFLRRKDIQAGVKLAIAHYQILMIHPFFDGNGRLSRMLALINAQSVLGRSRAFAIAAALAMHRRKLRDLFQNVRTGNFCNYLAYWEKLVAWSDVCVVQAARFRELAADKISRRLTMFKSIERLTTFLIETPLFTRAQLASELRLSDKLESRYIDQLSSSEVIELHPSADGIQYFRCPISVGYWRQVMENTALTSTQLLESQTSSCSVSSVLSQTPPATHPSTLTSVSAATSPRL